MTLKFTFIPSCEIKVTETFISGDQMGQCTDEDLERNKNKLRMLSDDVVHDDVITFPTA